MPLTMVRCGEIVKFRSVNGGRNLQLRLAEMGMVPGAELEVISGSIGGAYVVAVKGSRVMLGQGMAHRIMVN